jgi:hypothetical protein
LCALAIFTPKTTSSNDTIQITLDDPGLYLTEQISISSKLLAEKPIIGCLITHESEGDNSKTGAAGEIGILQFLPITFKEYSQKYGLALDIHNPEDQIVLAYEMIKNGLIKKWSTYSACI